MIRILRFEKTDSDDYLVTNQNESKTLAVIRPQGDEWIALLPQDNGAVSVRGVAMAAAATGEWKHAIAIIMDRLLRTGRGTAP